MGQEKNFEDRVKDFLKAHGNWFIKYWGGGMFTKVGVPDLLVCSFGQFMGIELKADNGEPTLLQLRQLQLIRDAGGWGILLYPRDFESFKEWFVSRMRGKAFYLANIDAQKRWKAKLEERSEDDGGQEEGAGNHSGGSGSDTSGSGGESQGRNHCCPEEDRKGQDG